MSLALAIRKAATGETLSDAEREILQNFHPDEQIQELETLRSACQSAGEERDLARRELDDLRFRQEVTELANHHGFADPDYLGYLCRRREIAPGDATSVEPLLDELRKQSPRLFRLDLQPGSGTPPARHAAPAVPAATGADYLTELIGGAPEITN